MSSITDILDGQAYLCYYGYDLVQSFWVEPNSGDLSTYSVYAQMQIGDIFTKAAICLFDDYHAAEQFALDLFKSWKRVSERERLHNMWEEY